MSAPRKPFGRDLPGRLPATMLKVLAAEMSDHGRLSRGKRYWTEDAVTDIVIGHGAVTAEVQGGRKDPYIVTLETSPGDDLPSKREVWTYCTCPDDPPAHSACKHAVAALFALSNEVSIEPTLIDRWRQGRARDRDRTTDDADQVTPEPVDARPAADELAAVVPIDRLARRERLNRGWGDEPTDAGPVEPAVDEPDPEIDQIAAMLRAPGGAEAPIFAEVSPLDHGSINQPLLAEVFESVLDEFHIRWS